MSLGANTLNFKNPSFCDNALFLKKLPPFLLYVAQNNSRTPPFSYRRALRQLENTLVKKGKTTKLFKNWPPASYIADYANIYYFNIFAKATRLTLASNAVVRRLSCINIMFRNHFLHFNVSNSKSRVLFSLRAGFFKKIFENRKSFKKSPVVATLLMKALRKYLIIIAPLHTYCRITGAPFSLSNLFHTLETPILHKFKNPVTGLLINEEKSPMSPFAPFFFAFVKNHISGSLKLKKRGRVKRKIYRKLIQKF
jgi:hypothetical protein